MAAPNIVNVTSIVGKTSYLVPDTVSATVLLANSASTGKVFRVNQITAANTDGSNQVDVTVAVNSAADGSGTSYPIVSTVAIPADATLIVTDKTTSFYLEEDKSVVVTAGASSSLALVVSYEEIN